MPRLMRRETRRRASFEELSDDQALHLMRGFFYFEGFTSLSEFTAAWRLHAVALTARFNREERNAECVRPFGWWLIDHKKERPIIADRDCRDYVAHERAQPEHFGFLHTHVYGWPGPLQENEADYLARLGRLTAEEIRFLR